MELEGAADCPGSRQQVEGAHLRLFTGGDHRFVFRRVFIRLEQYFVELRLDWLWTLLGTQRRCPLVNLSLDGLTFGNAR